MNHRTYYEKPECLVMGKKKLLPQQKSPIVRSTTAKSIPGLEETTLTEGSWTTSGGLGSITPSHYLTYFLNAPFAGDGDE
ncbi:MAG: hypothetical protein F6K65_14050 [Moorea sp. SIO3C2]|nr:hypothetical protein [Moorena sp. SIO3C2]